MTLNWSLNKKVTLSYLTLSLVFLTSAFLLKSGFEKPELDVSQQEKAISLNENLVKIASGGQYRFVSSLLWAETLLKADIKHYSGSDLNNWMFHRLQLITSLDPYFYSAYLIGGIYLSIVKDDDKGAGIIYDKGLSYYPDDFYLNLNASFHYFYEQGNLEKSIEALEKIVKDPRIPRHLPSLLSRMKAETGDLNNALTYLQEMINTVPQHSILYKKMQENAVNIQIEIDLNCLQSNLKGCNLRDPYGKLYVKNKKGSWISTSPWRKIRIKKKKKN